MHDHSYFSNLIWQIADRAAGIRTSPPSFWMPQSEDAVQVVAELLEVWGVEHQPPQYERGSPSTCSVT